MYLLYLDESGSPNARHFVLAGVSVYETSVYWATDELNRLQSQYFPDLEGSVQFHASPLRGAPSHRIERPFDQLPPATRHQLLSQLYDVVQEVYGQFFAVVVEKSWLNPGEDPYERALEEIMSRFDRFLNRMYREQGRRDRGLLVIADSGYRERLEAVARQFVTKGTRWSELHGILDIPFFTMASNSRMLQIADLVANTVYGRYESGHASQFDRLLPKFDQDENGRMHGLVHLTRDRAQCYQPCCRPR